MKKYLCPNCNGNLSEDDVVRSACPRCCSIFDKPISNVQISTTESLTSKKDVLPNNYNFVYSEREKTDFRQQANQIKMEASGVNGQIEFLENKIRIRRKGLMSLMTQGLRGDKEIFIKQISAIQLKKAGMLTNGFIQFTFIGGQEAKGGLFQSAGDENTIVFTSSQQSNFEKIKEAIEKKLFSTESSGSKPSNLDELEKLARLRKQEIITEEEFNAKKKQLLGL